MQQVWANGVIKVYIDVVKDINEGPATTITSLLGKSRTPQDYTKGPV